MYKRQALAQAGCPVLSLSAETMSLEDVFLQLTETPETGTAGESAPAAESAESADTNEKEAGSDGSDF